MAIGGFPAHMVSDNGKTFKAAARNLRKVVTSFEVSKHDLVLYHVLVTPCHSIRMTKIVKVYSRVGVEAISTLSIAQLHRRLFTIK